MADEDLAILLGKRFIERRDVKARQYGDGHYEPDVHHNHPQRGNQCVEGCAYLPWSMPDIHAHIDGTSTFGHYLLSAAGNVKLFAFDIDLTVEGSFVQLTEGPDETFSCRPREAWLRKDDPARPYLLVQLRTMAEGLALRTKELVGCDVAVAYSGSKGFHVYGFTGSMPAVDARELAMLVLNSFGDFVPLRGENFFGTPGEHKNLEIEVFPKQDAITANGFGNLMRMPLGKNLKSGHPGFFVDMNTPYNVLRAADPREVLTNGQNW